MRSINLDLVLTNNCVTISGTNAALGLFRLCDAETMRLRNGCFQGFSRASASMWWFLFPKWALLSPRKGVQGALKPDHLGDLKLIGI